VAQFFAIAPVGNTEPVLVAEPGLLSCWWVNRGTLESEDLDQKTHPSKRSLGGAPLNARLGQAQIPQGCICRWLGIAHISILGHTGLQGWRVNSLLDWLKQVSPVVASTIGLLLVQSPRAM